MLKSDGKPQVEKRSPAAAHAERLKAIEHLQFYGQNTVKMLFLLNAGSILALLAFLGALYSKGDPTVLGVAKS